MCHVNGCIFTRKVSDSVFFWERSKMRKMNFVHTLVKNSKKIHYGYITYVYKYYNISSNIDTFFLQRFSHISSINRLVRFHQRKVV